MKHRTNALLGTTLLCAAVVAAAAPALGAGTLPPDPGWPRVFKKGGKEVTVYQPQVDYWRDYTNIHFRAAIAVEGGGLKEETFGVAEVEAVTLTDLDNRTVAVTPTTRDVRFPNMPEAEATLARQIANEVHPFGQVTTISLDRVLAYVDPAQQPQQVAVELNLDPPTIFYSAVPAVLVIFMGKPQLVAVAPERKDLMFAVNTNWDVLYDQASARWLLLAGEGWLTAPDAIEGPWTPVKELPAALSTLPADDNWAEARKRIPAQPLEVVPVVYASAQPAELILTKGEATYLPVPDTALKQVTNTESALFLHTGEDRFYFLVAGRWFRASSLDGPWTVASRDLPADFAQIPDDHPAAFVKASVPGTRAAQDAILLASIPNMITVENKPVTEQVIYSGDPKFVAVEGTTVQSAVNTPMSVFLVEGDYYWCYQGAWLQGTSPNGPWTFATSVPTAIYSIPPSHPSYNVTYVTVYNSAPATSTEPATVTYSQTSGYSGEYVASTGVLMFGVGLLAGAALADSSTSSYPYYYPYYYPPPHYYAYGGAVTYNHAYGGYYTGASAYGPYGGAGWAAGYNPSTGTYARGASAYGPYGAAGYAQAYNPYTGAYAQGGAVSTAYGSAARGQAYNPTTGAYAAGRSANTAYGSAGGFYAEKGGESAWGGYRSGEYGSAAGVKTSSGSGAAAWDTQQGQGAAAKTKSGDVYVGHDDTVYKREAEGGWSSNTGSGWQSVESPQSTRSQQAQTSAQSSAQERSQSAQQQAQASGQQRSQSAQQEAQASGQQRAQSAQQQAQASGQQRAQSAQSTAQGSAQQAQGSMQQRASGATASGGGGSSIEQLNSQAQARQHGNAQSERASQFRSSGGSASRSGGAQRSRSRG